MRMREIIEKAKMVTESNHMLRLFHASPKDITRFAPLSHFGTEQAARRRASNSKYLDHQMKLYAVDFISNNPVRVRDLSVKKGAMHNWSNLTDMLYYTVKKISASERDAIYAVAAPSGQNTSAGERALIETLEAHGWDSIVYRNVFEDTRQDSWINLTPEQVKIVDVIEIS